jgi:hypothetical protein
LSNNIENGDQSPQSSNKSIGKSDSPIIQNESNREYKHVTDFTGPTVTHTTKVRLLSSITCFFSSNKYVTNVYLNKMSDLFDINYYLLFYFITKFLIFNSFDLIKRKYVYT